MLIFAAYKLLAVLMCWGLVLLQVGLVLGMCMQLEEQNLFLIQN
jgi:hypothetical protein